MAWLTEERLRLYPTALFVAVVAAFAFAVITADGARTATGTLGGDYAAFHSVGALVLEGRTQELYDWQAQAAAQADLHPDDPGAFLPFVYPPFVAMPYAVLAGFGFRGGYVLHTLLAGLALWGTILAIATELPRVGRYRFAAFVAALLFYPLLRAVPGGQNTSFSLLLLAMTWRWTAMGKPVAAGVAAGLLLFKPQLGLPLVGLVGVRHPRALVGAGLSAAGLYAAGAAAGGLGWPVWWWSQIGRFHTLDQGVNAGNSVGVLGFVEALMGVGAAVAVGVGATLSGALALASVALWRADTVDPTTRWALTAVLLVLIPPHSMFYDGGLAVIALLVWADRAASPAGVAVTWLAALLTPLSAATGVSPLFPVIVALGAAVWLTRPNSPGPARPVDEPPNPAEEDASRAPPSPVENAS